MPGPEGMERCIGEVLGAGGEKANREDAQGILDLVDQHAESLARTRGLSGREAHAEAARELVDIEAASAAKLRLNRILNRQKREARTAQLQHAAEALGKDGKPDLARAIRNQITAVNAPIKEGRAGAELAYTNLRKGYHEAVVHQLDKAGLLKAVSRGGDFERQWGIELAELSRKAAGDPDAKPGRTGNRLAKQVADILHPIQELAKQRQNREGAWIGDYSGFISSTEHDPDKIRRAGKEGWMAAIRPLLDEGRTFAGAEGDQGRIVFSDKMLSNIWDAFVSGKHFSDGNMVGMKDPAFSGPGNLAKRASQSRVLHFKDAESWLTYQRQFGRGTLFEQVMNGLDRAARRQALLERWGTNPKAEFQADIQRLGELYRSSHPEQVEALSAAEKQLMARFDGLTGELNRPAKEMWGQIGAGLRVMSSLAHLGGVGLTHISAAATRPAELRYQGVKWLDRYGSFIEAMVQGPQGRGANRVLADYGLSGHEGMYDSILSRFQHDDGIPGGIARASNLFFRWSGLTWLLDANKASQKRIMARFLGGLVDQEHDALPPELQRAFMQYGISPKDWDTLRQAPDHPAPDGRVHLTPDAAYRAIGAPEKPAPGYVRFFHGFKGQEPVSGGGRYVTTDPNYARDFRSGGTPNKVAYVDLKIGSPEEIAARIGPDAGNYAHVEMPEHVAQQMKPYSEGGGLTEAARDKLGTKLAGYYSDVADRGIITPGIEERILFRSTTQPGTLMGELSRFIAQFKTWGAAAVRQGLGRELYGGQGVYGAASGILQLALSTALVGYGIIALKDLAKGKNPRPPSDPRTWLAALMQGGGFGILGDFLFADQSRLGGGLADTLAGPVLGGVTKEAMKLAADVRGRVVEPSGATHRQPAGQLLAGDALRIATDNAPFINLFYTRTALNYLFLHSLQESLSPGYLRRMEQRAKQQQGQSYWLSPTQDHLRPFGR